MSKSEQAKLDQDMQDYKTSLLKQKEQYMEAHKTKISEMTQELEALQLQLQALGPQKLRGSTASLTASSVAEDTVENISGSTETEENPIGSQQEEENKTKDTDPETTSENENATSNPDPADSKTIGDQLTST